MTDKELDNYMKAVEPNFNSHIENGTIEMSNEYYNLLEEKMARLIAENQELKKQLEEYKNSQSCSFVNICKNVKIANYNQQKEFIKYMNNIINDLETEDTDDEEMKGYLIQRLNTFKEILQKYKEITGVSNENN